jgi:DNA polymerase-3 subunit epsilon
LVAIEHMKVLSLSNLSDVAKHFGYDLGHLHKDGLKRMSDFKYYPSSGSHSSTDYINSSKNVNATTEVDANGELFGKSIVFTGGLESMTRPNAIQRAVNNGASVTTGITKKTDYLIVGISDFLDFTNGIKTNKLKDEQRH